MKPFITICSLLLLMASCHSSTEEPLPPEPPVEEGTPLLFEPEEMVTITVGDETFLVDFSRSELYIQAMFDFPMSGSAHMKKTREAYIDRYKREKRYIVGASEGAAYAEIDFVQLEYTLAQECFSDRCDSETRKDVLQLVLDKQRPKYGRNLYGDLVYYAAAIHTGVFLMAVILVKERAYSAEYIDSETLQEALLFLNDFDYIPGVPSSERDFSDLIVECAQDFLTNNN